MTMKRILLACVLFLACQKPADQKAAEEKPRQLTEAPPPPALEIARAKEPDDDKGFKVAAGRPQGKLTGTARPTITFSEPVVALETLSQQDPATQIRIEPAVKGRWHWLGSSSVEFVNDEPFPFSTAFHVIVPAGFKALDGTPLANAWQLDFTTPTLEVGRYNVIPVAYACKWSVPAQHFVIPVNQPIRDPEKAFFFEAGDEKRMVAAKVIGSAPADNGVKYEIAPAQDLPRDARFAVGLDGDAHGTQGPLPAGTEWRQECRTMGAMAVVSVKRCLGESFPGQTLHCAHGPIAVEFTNPLGAAAELKTRLHVTPDPQLEWDDGGPALRANGTQIAIQGKFRPGTAYAVHIDAGVKDEQGQEAKAFDATVQMDDLFPSLYVGQRFALLEPSGDGQLPVQVTNLTSLEADLWALTPQQMAQLELNDRSDESVPARPPDAPLQLALNYPKNAPHLHGVDLRAALNGAKTGLVAVRLRSPETNPPNEVRRVLAQITDLAVHAKLGATSGLAWVTSVESGKGVAGAKVSVYGLEGSAAIAEAVTDASGLATLPGYGKLVTRKHGFIAPHLLVAAALGDDLGYSTTSAYGDDDEAPVDVNRNFDVLRKHGLGLIFADRGIYRPGDTVHIKAILREQEAGAMHNPAGATVQIKVRDPESKEMATQQVTLSKYGTFTVDAVVPKTARLGEFLIAAAVPKGMGYGYGSFTVAEYRAPQFRVDVQVPSAELTAGDELSGTVIARYLFGGAMDRAQVQWSAGRSTDGFSPPKNDGFRFGRNTWNWDDNAPGHDNGLFASGQGEIGKDGTLAVKAGKVDAPGDRTARYTLEAEVADVSRQRVAGRASVLVHPAAYYLGLGAVSLFAKAGENLQVPVIAATPTGDRVSAQVQVTALLRSWHAVRKRGVNGIYETLSEAVEEKAAACDVKSGETCKLMLAKPGFYNLRAESKDEKGRLALTTMSVYAVGGGFAAWQQSDSLKVEVVPDKESYAVGETAHLLIKSPYPSCRALISLEREGVADAHVVELTGTAATVDVPIREEHVPNVFAGVVLVRERVKEGGIEPGDDPGRPSMRIGYVNLKVGTSVKKLAVSVSTPKPEYKPREKVPVDVVVAGGRRAEVQLYAVDDAVLRLTGYQLPDPIAALFREHALSVALGEPLPRLVRRQKFGEKGEVQPGGGGGLGPPGDVRSKFVTTVLWQTLETGDDGKAHAEIELPDNLTTFRILAVAATDGDRFGAGQTEVRVSLPLLVLPALPRFARVGDEFEAGVAVHSVKQLEVKIKAEVGGAAAIEGETEKTVTVEAGVAKEVRFKLRGASAGKATLRFHASAGDLTDAVEQTIPIQVPVELEAVAVAGDTTGTKAEGLVPPQGVRKDVGGLELSLASTALGGMGEAMDQLAQYPYGCLEQLSSRLVPYVAVREMERVFGEPPHPDNVVTDTIAKIEQLQTPSGGFLYWPNSTCPYAWTSIYATMSLQRAQEMDYPVHKDVLVRAKRYLGQVAAGEMLCDRQSPGIETRIFALQVLARMGDPRPSYYDELYAQKEKLPLFSKAQLADAIAVGKGKRSQADALLQDVLDAARETPRDLHFEESAPGTYRELLSSDTRTTGMVLQTLVELNPKHPYVSKIARYLTDVRKGGAYRNTQEASYALMGLTELVRVKERNPPDFSARVLLGDKELASAEFRKRTLAVISKKVAISDLPSSGKQLPLQFKADGKGSLYYSALLRYAPLELPKQPRNEGLFVQRWFEPYNEAGKQATQFAAGELVRVRVRVATPQERSFVAVEVPLPAGLEAVDTTLATTRVVAREKDEEAQESDSTEGVSEQWAGFWSPFSYSEKRDDRVVYFADHLPPGVHVASFVARATTPGKFILKPAHAGEMYAPEVFGRSESGIFSVVTQPKLAQAP
jgi:uncharacterized protein YfaS (alpha-2-macroglobulin family)